MAKYLDSTGLSHLVSKIKTAATPGVDNSSIELSSGKLRVKAGGITANHIANSAIDGVTIKKSGGKLVASAGSDGSFGDNFVFNKTFINKYTNGITANVVQATTSTNALSAIHAQKYNYGAFNGKAYLVGYTNYATADVYITKSNGTTEHKSVATQIPNTTSQDIYVTAPKLSGTAVRFSVIGGTLSCSNRYDETNTTTLRFTVSNISVTGDNVSFVNIISDSIEVSQEHSYSIGTYPGYAIGFLPVSVGGDALMGGVFLNVDAVEGAAKQRCGCVKIASDGVVTKNTTTANYMRHYYNRIDTFVPDGFEQGIRCQIQSSHTNGTIYLGFSAKTDMSITATSGAEIDVSSWTLADKKISGITKRFTSDYIETRTYTGKETPSTSRSFIGGKKQPFSPTYTIPLGTYCKINDNTFLVKSSDGLYLVYEWQKFRIVQLNTSGNVKSINPNYEAPSANFSQTVGNVYSELFFDTSTNGAYVMFVEME